MSHDTRQGLQSEEVRRMKEAAVIERTAKRASRVAQKQVAAEELKKAVSLYPLSVSTSLIGSIRRVMNYSNEGNTVKLSGVGLLLSNETELTRHTFRIWLLLISKWNGKYTGMYLVFTKLTINASFQDAVKLANTALTYDPSFVKARYRRAVARKGLGFLDASIIGNISVLPVNSGLNT